MSEPSRAEAAFCDGVLAQIAGEPARAEICYRLVLSLEPGHQGACHHLAITLEAQGHGDDAIAVIAAGLQRFPEAATMWLTLGQMLHHRARHPEAVAALRQALARQSPYPEADNLLGLALAAQGQREAAIPHFKAALAAAPGQADAPSNLAAVLLDLDRAAEAVEYCRQALARQPGHVPAISNLGAALAALGHEAEALEAFRIAAALQPEAAEIRYSQGLILARLGRFAEAVAALDQAIALEPNMPRFHRARGLIGSVRLDELEALARDGATLPDSERIELHFALGAAYGELGRHEHAFDQWRAGNALKRQQINYDEAASLDRIERIRRHFTRELMASRSGGGHPSSRPVIIIGMPRSGSTLVEQMLASLPGVFGAGESYELPRLVVELATTRARVFPDFVCALGAAELYELGAEYDRRLGRNAPKAVHITDKMLSNFTFVGLIHLVLPKARIIHLSRDPIDTCLSCYTQLFAAEQPYCYELGELGHHYRAYQRLMAHWRAVLPAGVMLDVEYEAVIADPEAQSRRILAHLGLDWDTTCLEFHRTNRPVRTASLVQVRQPIYQGSVGRAGPYLPFLQPLLDALGRTPDGAETG
jgi:tetratricopeptide (TPR) repeat protein